MSEIQKSRSTLLIWLGTLCLVLSFFAVSQEIVEDHNKAVWQDEFNKKMLADKGATFAVDDSGLDYARRNRHLIFILCVTGFGLTFSGRLGKFSLIPYVVTIPLIWQWIDKTVRALSYSPQYMADSPYFLRVAGIFDWTLFGAIFITLTVIAVFLIKPSHSKK